MKYRLTDVKIEIAGKTLFQIEAIVSFGDVKKGDPGGYIEKEENLSQACGNAWVYGNAHVYGDAQVYGNAWVCGDARVYGNAQVCGNARVYDDARVYGNARVCGDARVYGNARVSAINITSLQYNVTILDTHIQIGCEYHSYEEWDGFNDIRIDAMDKGRSLIWWKSNKEIILGLYKANRKQRRKK